MAYASNIIYITSNCVCVEYEFIIHLIMYLHYFQYLFSGMYTYQKINIESKYICFLNYQNKAIID